VLAGQKGEERGLDRGLALEEVGGEVVAHGDHLRQNVGVLGHNHSLLFGVS
jgi:hypothetical protein